MDTNQEKDAMEDSFKKQKNNIRIISRKGMNLEKDMNLERDMTQETGTNLEKGMKEGSSKKLKTNLKRRVRKNRKMEKKIKTEKNLKKAIRKRNTIKMMTITTIAARNETDTEMGTETSLRSESSGPWNKSLRLNRTF